MKKDGSTTLGFFESVTSAFKKVFNFFDKPKLFKSSRVEDFPDAMKRFTLYLANGGAAPRAAALICPCGCGDTIQLNLLTGVRPCWQVEHTKGLVSLNPSIQRKNGCRSHFWLRNGEIIWCKAE